MKNCRIFFKMESVMRKKRGVGSGEWGVESGEWGVGSKTKRECTSYTLHPTPYALRPTPLSLLITLCALLFALCAIPAKAQFFDPQSSIILGVLREISNKHQLGLAEQRIQTANMVEQLKQFYDTYTILRQDVEFTQSLYRDFQAVENMNLSNSFAVTNLILNGDRLNYWLPSTTQQAQRSVMDSDALLKNADALRKTYDSFAVSTEDDGVPENAELRLANAYKTQEAFSRALFEQGLRSQRLAVTYDSLATELYRQVVNGKNKFTEAERTQLLLESVKLRDMSNTAYEKYLEIMQKVQNNELAMRDEKLGYLRSKVNWKTLQAEAKKVSKIRYGFFDITRGPIQ